MNPYLVAIVVPIIASVLLRRSKKAKTRGLPVDVGGEPGVAIRNYRFPSPLQSLWEGVSTLAELFEHSSKRFQHKPLLGSRRLLARETEVSPDGRSFEKFHLGNYEWISYGDAFKAACSFASGLVQLGHKRDEPIAIFSDTRAEWFIALQTEVSTVICGPKELKKVIDIKAQLNTVKRVVYIDEDGVSNEISLDKNTTWVVASFVEVERMGREKPVVPYLPKSADIAVIMYTSGSTGLPKGVMMTHGNVLATVSAVMTVVPSLGTKDIYMAYLPLAHILELAAEHVMVAAGTALGYGSPLTLIDTSNKIKKGTKGDTSVLKPTLMPAVPAILDRVCDGVRKKVDAKGGLSKKLFDISYGRRLAANNGSWFGETSFEKFFWNFLVFRKIQAVLGGRVRYLLSGGAPLSCDTQRFINICFGATVAQAYGLTETCAGGTFQEADEISLGAVGAPLPCSYVKLIDWSEGGYLVTDKPMPRGEVVIGGPNVTAGYFKNEEKTKEVYKVDERGMRWFYTGDIGRIHPGGLLEIIDRKKDIVKLQHGEYVSLGKVESALIVSSYVENIMLHADPFHNFCVALIVAAHNTLEDWASKQGINCTDFSDLCQKEETVKEVHGSLLKAAKQSRLDKFEIPAKIKLIPEPWTPESGLVTAALKLKREAVRKAYADDLQKLYA
ncbi:hypothetical protein ZIOFF_027078 [Zingiber officinale]|uniref:4-coumarate--CoA ligase n=1 Tax=Zingiber officinale TaxID=94328 RepID=A0A8J5HFF3_ZINOF|nr:hypothetical protein ZIOFF_027078 [Zingiber officinale]